MKKRANLQGKLKSILRSTNENSIRRRFVNLSKRNLPFDEINLLSKGIKFSHADATPKNFLANLESLLLTSLSGATGIMDKTDYINKANQIFNDRAAYTLLDVDPTKNSATAVKKKENPIGIPKPHVSEKLKLCFKNYCQFDDKYYQQVKGIPMGSPISGLLAELVLQRSEEGVLQRFKPKMYLRYVDGKFVIIKTCDVEQLHESELGLPGYKIYSRSCNKRYTPIPGPHPTVADEDASVENQCCNVRGAVKSTALDVFGCARCPHQAWFDDNDAAMSNLLT
ncbi:unnamed protein product [Schistocephalus solidus]|uniref:Reverse transcriptase domain-containing protein n=1 Tax=Schistocephalus solidus TaxID=70667 RepID=A0A183SLT2_SCHSO|nr:unnamed protein product [Schistocephalus solidus]